MTNTFTRDELLAAVKQAARAQEWVPVPEFGEGKQLLVTEWSARQRDHFDFLCKMQALIGNADRSPRAVFVAASVVDPETMRPMLSVEDVEAMAEAKFKPIDRVFQVAARLNPLTDTVIEDAAKNS